MADSKLSGTATSQHGAPDHPLVPHSFCCPITHTLFVDPVIASDGFTYERSAIERWFRSSDKSPVTGLRITRLIFPNHALRGAIEELYPGLAATLDIPRPITGTTMPVVGPSVDTFTRSREDIITASRSRFMSPPLPATVYYGIFEQRFTRGESLAKSRWTVRMEIESLDDHASPPALTAGLTWRKHEQLFEPSSEDFLEHDFANRLLTTVGGTFDCKVRGTFCNVNGTLDLYTYEGTNVGIGYYKLMLGVDTIDGCFFLPDFDDVGNPTTQGMGVLRMHLDKPDAATV